MGESIKKVRIRKLSFKQFYSLGELALKRCAEIAKAEVLEYFESGRSYEEFCSSLPRNFTPHWNLICDELNLPRWSSEEKYQSIYHSAKKMYQDSLGYECCEVYL